MKEYRTWFTGRVSRKLPKEWALGASWGFNQLKTGNLDAQIDLPNDLSIRDVSAETQLTYTAPRVTWLLAAGGRISDVRQSNGSTDQEQRKIHTRSEVEWNPTDRTALSLKTHATTEASTPLNPASISYLVGIDLRHQKAKGASFATGLSLIHI